MRLSSTLSQACEGISKRSAGREESSSLELLEGLLQSRFDLGSLALALLLLVLLLLLRRDRLRDNFCRRGRKSGSGSSRREQKNAPGFSSTLAVGGFFGDGARLGLRDLVKASLFKVDHDLTGPFKFFCSPSRQLPPPSNPRTNAPSKSRPNPPPSASPSPPETAPASIQYSIDRPWSPRPRPQTTC